MTLSARCEDGDGYDKKAEHEGACAPRYVARERLAFVVSANQQPRPGESRRLGRWSLEGIWLVVISPRPMLQFPAPIKAVALSGQ